MNSGERTAAWYLPRGCFGQFSALPRRHVLALRLPAALRADARAVAQEVLDLALVAVGLLIHLLEGLAAQRLGHPHGGLAGRVAQPVAGGLELAVVQAAAEAQVLDDLVGDVEA